MNCVLNKERKGEWNGMVWDEHEMMDVQNERTRQTPRNTINRIYIDWFYIYIYKWWCGNTHCMHPVYLKNNSIYMVQKTEIDMSDNCITYLNWCTRANMLFKRNISTKTCMVYMQYYSKYVFFYKKIQTRKKTVCMQVCNNILNIFFFTNP